MKKQTLLVLLLGAILLIGLFILLKPKNQTQKKETITQENNQQLTPTPSENIYQITIENQKLVSGNEIIKVIEGQEILFQIKSDVEEELHLHGYDLSSDIGPNEIKKLQFTAQKTGRFPFELEHSGIEIGVLEVQPK